MSRWRQTILCLALPLLGILFPAASQAAEYTMPFTSWTFMDAYGYQEFEGWVLNEGMIRKPGQGPTNPAGFVCYMRPDFASASLTSAPLTNGVGRVDILVALAAQTTSMGIYLIEGGTTSLVETLSVPAGTLITRSSDVNAYSDTARVMIKKEGTTTGDFRLQSVSVFEAPAKVELGPVALAPEVPLINDAVTVAATLLPSSLASNVVATHLDYVAGVATGQIAMSQTSPNVFETDTPIPGFAEGVTVDMTIAVTFEGPAALSPTNLLSAYVVQGRDFFSSYSAVSITGTLATANLIAVDDYEWEGVVQPASSGLLRFAATPTNQPAPVDLWGDSAPATDQIPFDGSATIGAGPIAVNGFAFTDLLARFCETNGAYLLNACINDDFGDWAPHGSVGDYSQSDWSITQGQVLLPPPADVYRGQACSLPNSDSSFRSAPLPDGLGEISFWLRNSATVPATGTLTVEVSPTGGSGPAEWQTVDTLADVSSPAFTLYRLPLNTRYHSYVRLRNSGSDAIEIDSVVIQHAGAGLSYSNLVTTPAAPSATETISVTVDAARRGGATPPAVVLYWRTKDDVSYTPIGMTLTAGTTYQTDSPIPAGQG